MPMRFHPPPRGMLRVASWLEALTDETPGGLQQRVTGECTARTTQQLYML